MSASVAALLLTHYFTVATIASCALYAAVSLPAKLRWRAWRAMAVGAVVAAAIWGPFLWNTRQIFHEFSWYALDNSGALGVLQQAVLAPGRLVLDASATGWAAAIAIALIVLVPPLFQFKGPARLWYSVVILNLLMLAAIDIYRHSLLIGFVKYTLLASPAIYALIARPWPVRFGKSVPVLVLAGTLTFTIQYAPRSFMPDLPDWKAVAAAVDRADPAALILFNGFFGTEPGFDYFVVNHYRPIRNRIVLTTDYSRAPISFDSFPEVCIVGMALPSPGAFSGVPWKPAHVLRTGGFYEAAQINRDGSGY